MRIGADDELQPKISGLVRAPASIERGDADTWLEVSLSVDKSLVVSRLALKESIENLDIVPQIQTGNTGVWATEVLELKISAGKRAGAEHSRRGCSVDVKVEIAVARRSPVRHRLTG